MTQLGPIVLNASSPADILASLLQSLPDFQNLGVPIHVGVQPNTPDNVITIKDTAQRSDARIMSNSDYDTHYGVQFRVRGINHQVAFNIAYALLDILIYDIYYDTVNTIPNDPNSYLIICLVDPGIFYMGMDSPQSRRVVFTINALVPIVIGPAALAAEEGSSTGDPLVSGVSCVHST